MDRSRGGPVNRARGPLIPGRWLASGALATLLLTSCGPETGVAETDDGLSGNRRPEPGGVPALVIDFETAPELGQPITTMAATVGSATLTSVGLGDGEVLVAAGPEGGKAARFPTSPESAAGGRAVLRVDTTGIDALAPGAHGFQFGVDLMYPEGSEGDSIGDDGDNVFQRGLFGDQGQFKLQVDHGRPACRIAGAERETLVKARETLEPDQWYSVWCQRAAGEITLFVAELGSTSDPVSWESWSVPDRAGPIPSGDGPVPVSIGGKLNPDGQVVTQAPDQFSGVLDNVVFLSLKR